MLCTVLKPPSLSPAAPLSHRSSLTAPCTTLELPDLWRATRSEGHLKWIFPLRCLRTSLCTMKTAAWFLGCIQRLNCHHRWWSLKLSSKPPELASAMKLEILSQKKLCMIQKKDNTIGLSCKEDWCVFIYKNSEKTENWMFKKEKQNKKITMAHKRLSITHLLYSQRLINVELLPLDQPTADWVN